MGNRQSEPDEPLDNELGDGSYVPKLTSLTEDYLGFGDNQGHEHDLHAPAPLPHIGHYVILYDRLPVTSLKDRHSFEVAKLEVGTRVEVVEVAPRPLDFRIRARLRAPEGWISLRTAQDDQPCQTIFAQACESELSTFEDREYISADQLHISVPSHDSTPNQTPMEPSTPNIPRPSTIVKWGKSLTMYRGPPISQTFTSPPRTQDEQQIHSLSNFPPTNTMPSHFTNLPPANTIPGQLSHRDIAQYQLALLGPQVPSNGLGSNLHFADTPENMRMPKNNEVFDQQAGYAGERDEMGRRHGDGTQILPDGRRYSGQFVKNTFNGAGMMVWPDGHKYTGQYENNQKHGDGFFLWPDGRCYDGQWKNGQRHGHGQYIAAESYVGEYSEGFRHGDGVLIWPDGKRYSGQFCRGTFHGSAVMTWPDGREYFGQYVDNLKEGEGLFHWPDGRMYDGQWHKGLRHGNSRFLDHDGIEYEGQWKKDRLAKSKVALVPGARDPFCEAPMNLLSLRPSFKTDADLANLLKPGGAGDSMHTDARDNIPPVRIPGSLGRYESRGSSRGKMPLGRGASSGIESSVLSASDVTLDIVQDRKDTEPDRGEVYIDFVPDDVNVIKIDGVAHPLYDLVHLRRMPLRALRDHASSLSSTFEEAIGSYPPSNDQALIGWVYEVQSRHLKPILELALRDVGGDLKEDVLVVSADSLHHLEGIPVASRQDNNRKASERDKEPTNFNPTQTASETSTQFYRSKEFRGGDDVATADGLSDDHLHHHNMVSQQTLEVPDNGRSTSKRRRERQHKDEDILQK